MSLVVRYKGDWGGTWEPLPGGLEEQRGRKRHCVRHFVRIEFFVVVVVVVVRHFCEAVRSRPDLLLVTLRKSWKRELGELLGLIVRGIGFGGNYTPGQPQSPSLVHHCEWGGQRLVH